MFVEVSHSQALRDTQNQNNVDWATMVAFGIAIVVSSPYVTKLDTLNLLIAGRV